MNTFCTTHEVEVPKGDVCGACLWDTHSKEKQPQQKQQDTILDEIFRGLTNLQLQSQKELPETEGQKKQEVEVFDLSKQQFQADPVPEVLP